MDNNYIITVIGKQTVDGESDQIEVITEGDILIEDEKITIVFNMDTFDQTITLDQSVLGYTELVGELQTTDGKITVTEDGKIVMPPQSIAIFK